ncbi:MAG: hypothetical protein MUF81_14565 [Verrucomicrobia bacterium]|nr:hypothetical protein [Verrucomicrobiota bacterium]
MKTSKLWKTLTPSQRRTWSAWAKDNTVLLADGRVRRVSGRKAMTVVVGNRAVAGEAANPAVVPAAANWLDGALSLRESGPFTEGIGYVGFRADVDIPAGTKWFVWATQPVDDAESNPARRLRFVKCMALDAMEGEDTTPNLGPDYAAVNGSWDDPDGNPEWPTPHYVWFRLHQYANGQLSPGRMLRSQIVEEL